MFRESSAWSLFFLISAGLGYPTLNRYDPRAALPDAAAYAQMATSGASSVSTHLRYRVLVPSLARAVFSVAKGHTGSWDALMFSFLVVNAALVATAAYLILCLGRNLLNDSVALLAATLYLLNFAIGNLHLAGLVDAAEACFLMAIVASVLWNRWWLLPVWGVLGALAKESFIPFSITMVLAWWVTSGEKKTARAFFWIALTALAEIAVFAVVHYTVSGHATAPWAFAAQMNSPSGYLANLWNSLVDRNSWYILIWLLPLGLAGTKQLPTEWKAAALAGVGIAIVLNAYHSTVRGGGGGLGRYIFNIAGPLLSLGAAAFLSQLHSGQPSAGAAAGER